MWYAELIIEQHRSIFGNDWLFPNLCAETLQHIHQEAAANEVVIVSTCNRTEIYSSHYNKNKLLECWARQSRLELSEIQSYLYFYQDREAVRHLFRVACGLDSMVPGEVQIFGQLKTAFQQAVSQQSIGTHLLQLFQYAFSVVKTIRTETGISDNAVSIAYCAIHLAKMLFADLKNTKALLVGAGETIELLIRYLTSQPLMEVCIVNRSLNKAKELADQYHVKVDDFTRIPQLLPQYDLVFTGLVRRFH